jgi:exosortase F-associated protein
MNNYIKIIQALILFSLFILVRAFESQLFYDPLLEYFKNDYLYKPIYDMDVMRLTLNMLFR